MKSKRQRGEILFEFWHVGNSVRVAALDPVTNTEVVIIGDLSNGQKVLERIAARKLQYVIDKKRKQAQERS